MAKHLITKQPDITTCRDCGVFTLSGIESGVPYTVDTWPCTALYELAVRQLGKASYCLVRGELRFHNVDMINAHGDSVPVVTDHVCGTPDPSYVAPAHIATLRTFLASRVQGDDDTARALGILHAELGARVYADEPPF